ncbi:MAG TPA: glutamate--tRNA ligase [Gammaproteobacteria bacterium]|nr:glutamate--tRNA ligase [Gammaproteobacteria bacterium]
MMIRTRFAPSPTGSLHIGGVRTALFSWLYAKHNQGEFILRIEDTDRERSTDESTQIILDSMKWLGLDFDEGPYYQSARLERYKEVIKQLIETGNAYYCYCTKEEVNTMRDEAIKRGEKPRYNGFWRDRKESPPSDVDPVVRFKTPLDGQIIVDDLVQGKVVFDNKELDDLIIARADGSPTYNLTVVVDDMDMKITDVIRGDDHFNNTPRQVNILNALDMPLPNYAHVPMILSEAGKKISKRDDISNILKYKNDGYLHEAILNYLVRLGWSKGDQEVFSIEEMISEFDIKDVNKSASRINDEKLLWLNQEYLKNADNVYLKNLLVDIFNELSIQTDTGPDLNDLIEVQKKRTITLRDMADQSIIFYIDSIQYDAKLAEKFLKPIVLEPMQTLYKLLENMNEWNNENLKEAIEKSANSYDIKMAKLAQPLRVAVTGKNISPSIDDTLRLLGKKNTLKRLNSAIDYIENLSPS